MQCRKSMNTEYCKLVEYTNNARRSRAGLLIHFPLTCFTNIPYQKQNRVCVVFFSDTNSVLKIFLQVLNPLFSSAFHLLETVLFHPELLLFFSVSHPTLSHLPSQIITSDQYPLPRNLFSLLRHSSLSFNLLHLMVFLSTRPSNKPMKRGIDNSYFLHLLCSEQYQVGRTQVKSGKTPH